MPRLTSPTGATVNVAAGKVDELLRRGFKKASEPTKAAAKKTTPKAASRSTE